jgi:hypothetical protein
LKDPKKPNYFVMSTGDPEVLAANIGLTATDEVKAIYRVLLGATEEVKVPFEIEILDPNVHMISYTVEHKDTNFVDTVFIEKRYPFEQITHLKFDDCFLFVCNNPVHTGATGKEKFVGFEWYKNGSRIPTQYNGNQYLIEGTGNDLQTFLATDYYNVELTTSSGKRVGTCAASTSAVSRVRSATATGLNVYPVPLRRGTPVTVELPHAATDADGHEASLALTKSVEPASSELQSVDNQRVEIYDLMGNRLCVYYFNGDKATFTPDLPAAGAYIIKWEGITKVVVAE